MISKNLLPLLSLLILAFGGISYAGTQAEVTFTLERTGQSAVASATTVDLAEPLTIPLIFSDGTKPWICKVTAISSKGQLTERISVTVMDSSILMTLGKENIPLTIFSGKFAGQWTKLHEVTIFKSGGTILKMKVRPIGKNG